MQTLRISCKMVVISAILCLIACTDRKITENSSAPFEASNPYPENGAILVSPSVRLTWEGSDPDNDPLVYNFYFGTDSNPPLLHSDYPYNYWDISGLSNNTDYYWKITSRDTQENFTVGTVWHFSVVNSPPEQITYLSPADGATNIGIDFELTWYSVDPDSENLACEVYLGTNPDPPLVSRSYPRERYVSPWKIQTRCNELLLQIHAAQQSYRQQYGAYCLNGATASYWTPDEFAMLGISFSEIDYYTYTMTASSNTYSCIATANIDIDATNDIWGIDQNGDLVCISNDLEDPFQYDTVHYWKIVARDSFGQEISGPIWSFTTAPQ